MIIWICSILFSSMVVFYACRTTVQILHMSSAGMPLVDKCFIAILNIVLAALIFIIGSLYLGPTLGAWSIRGGAQ